MVDRVRHRLLLEGHLVELAEVLLDLMLAQVGRRAEPHLVLLHRLRGPGQDHFVVHEFDALTRLLETGRDRWLDTLRAQVLLKFKSFLVVVSQLVEILLAGLGGRLEVAQILRVEVPHLHRVPHLKVDLLGVEAKPLHFHNQIYNNY